MNFKKNGGFTLVELIVVIAILGLLAGIAVPQYSQYVEKAQIAADNQNIVMLHNMLQVACADAGKSVEDVASVTANWSTTEDKTLLSLDTVTLTTPSAAYYSRRGNTDGEKTPEEKIKDTFNSFMPSEGVGFKKKEQAEILTEIVEGLSDVKVVTNEDGTVTYTVGKLSVTLNPYDADLLAGENAFSDRGSKELLNDVAVLENLLATGIGKDVLTSLKQSDEFLWALGGYAGLVQGEDECDDTYLDRVAGYMVTADEDAVYSAQIMYAASQAANATPEQISALFTGTGAVTSRIEKKNDDDTTDYAATMANAALAYGMYTAYVQQNNIDTSTNEGNFTNVINSDAFASYYAGQGQTDLEAYKAAMNIISDNTGNSDVTGSILENGIANNADLAALMKEIMGS